MNDSKAKKALIFESSFDLRDTLIKIYEKDGMIEFEKYISEEFTTDREIQLGDKTAHIFDVQLRYLHNGKPGNIIIDFKHKPTVLNSMLFSTSNLIHIKSEMQLLIRKCI